MKGKKRVLPPFCTFSTLVVFTLSRTVCQWCQITVLLELEKGCFLHFALWVLWLFSLFQEPSANGVWRSVPLERHFHMETTSLPVHRQPLWLSRPAGPGNVTWPHSLLILSNNRHLIALYKFKKEFYFTLQNLKFYVITFIWNNPHDYQKLLCFTKELYDKNL